MWVFLRTCIWYAHHWDTALSYALTLREDQPSRLSARVLAHLGDSVLWYAGAAGAWIWARRRGRRGAQAQRLLLLLALTTVASLVVKMIVRRARPGGVEPLAVGPGPDQHSFPSGHAVRMAAVAVWLGSLNRWLGALGALLALAVGWGRVRLGLHFAGDVVAGYALGASLAWVVKRVGRESGVGSRKSEVGSRESEVVE